MKKSFAGVVATTLLFCGINAFASSSSQSVTTNTTQGVATNATQGVATNTTQGVATNTTQDVATNNTQGVATNNTQVVTTNHDIKQLANLNILLDDHTGPAKVDKNTAIENAEKAFPGWALDAKQVKVEYHLVTNPTFTAFSPDALEKNSDLKAKGHMEKLPVYIVSFVGMSYVGNVPPNFHGQPPIHHEYNVIVDANSGEPLMGFSYR